MKGERMRKLDLHINESSPVIGNFLSLHFSFSFFHHLSFCWVFFLPLPYVLFHVCSILCKSSMKLAHILISEKNRNKNMSPCYYRVRKAVLKGRGTEIRAKFSNIPLLKEVFSVILRSQYHVYRTAAR